MGLILVDSSVWIDRLCKRQTLQTLAFERLLAARHVIGIGDLIAIEVLQGTRDERHPDQVKTLLSAFDAVQISDHAIAAQAAGNYRYLRDRGITIRKTIATLIATRCIVDHIPLLYGDRDYDPFVQHLGLRSALDLPE